MIERNIRIGDTNLNYKSFFDNKNKDSFLILHWWWWSSDSWSKVWELLFDNWFNVFIPDLPWFGKTKLNKVYIVEDYADLIEEFIVKTKLNNFNLLWHSNWWRISICLCLGSKLKINKLFLVWSAGVERKIWIKQKFFWWLSKLLDFEKLKNCKNMRFFKFARRIFYKIIWWQDYLACDNLEKRQTFLNVLNSNLESEMKEIKIPTELIWWDRDTYTPLADWIKINRIIKGSNLTILKWEKHWIHLKSPEKLVKVILEKFT